MGWVGGPGAGAVVSVAHLACRGGGVGVGGVVLHGPALGPGTSLTSGLGCLGTCCKPNACGAFLGQGHGESSSLSERFVSSLRLLLGLLFLVFPPYPLVSVVLMVLLRCRHLRCLALLRWLLCLRVVGVLPRWRPCFFFDLYQGDSMRSLRSFFTAIMAGCGSPHAMRQRQCRFACPRGKMVTDDKAGARSDD